MLTDPAAQIKQAGLFSAVFQHKRYFLDRVARWVFTLGGWLVLGSICAILVVIFSQIWPLFAPARLELEQFPENHGNTDTVALQMSDAGRDYVLIGRDGSIQLNAEADPLTDLNLQIAFISRGPKAGEFLIIGTKGEGRILEISFPAGNGSHDQQFIPKVKTLNQFQLTQAVPLASHALTKTGLKLAYLDTTGQLFTLQRLEKRSLGGAVTSQEQTFPIEIRETEGQVTALALDERGEYLFVGTSAGNLLLFALKSNSAPQFIARASLGSAVVSKLQFLVGGRTLIAGSNSGELSSWQVLTIEGQKTLFKIYDFPKRESGIVTLAASRRNRTFVAGTAAGEVALYYGTTGKEIISDRQKIFEDQSFREVLLSNKSDAVMALGSNGSVARWAYTNKHPEVSWKSLFAPLIYEGYSTPQYVWQSSGGSDDFEPKLSITPLIVGTLKGTFYALIFAVPVALLSAFYMAQFMSPRLKSLLKPTLELMAALPSVVIGFLASLWLAPFLEFRILGLILAPVLVLFAVFISSLCYQAVINKFSIKHKRGIELLIITPVVLLVLLLTFRNVAHLETLIFGVALKDWLYSYFSIAVDQRNSLVAGLAVGIAVIPVIFTIAEDSIASVPKSLSAAALALGASRWQTALLVVAPVALPGIFAGIMIGLGRAVGETMIVLMATGNTAILDMLPFSGFRALSANIAVELPEAPEGGTLYRVLFLSALVLFLMTFVINTISEYVRTSIRRKYGRL